jgi:hypothetical protein
MRWTAGRRSHDLSEEERGRMGEDYRELVEKWKSAGVKPLGYWNSGPLDGFCHYQIFEVSDISTVRQMNLDLNQYASPYIDAYELHIGFSGPFEEVWQST